jgi:hypothetical protein
MLLKHLIFFHESKEKNLQALGSDKKKNSKEKKTFEEEKNGNILKYFFKNILR